MSYGHPTKWFAFGLDASIRQALETFWVVVVPLGHVLPEVDASMEWYGMATTSGVARPHLPQEALIFEPISAAP